MTRSSKMQHCWYCGAELGVYVAYYGDRETCGETECVRAVRDAELAERDEAHEQLDQDRGWR